MLFSVSSVLFFNRFSLGLQLIMGHPSDTDVLLPKERGAGGQARRRQQARAGEESGRACWQRLRQIKPVTIRHYCQEPQSSVQSSDVASKYQLSSEAVYPFCWGVSSDLVLYIRHETTVPGYKVSFFLLLKSHFESIWHYLPILPGLSIILMTMENFLNMGNGYQSAMNPWFMEFMILVSDGPF